VHTMEYTVEPSQSLCSGIMVAHVMKSVEPSRSLCLGITVAHVVESVHISTHSGVKCAVYYRVKWNMSDRTERSTSWGQRPTIWSVTYFRVMCTVNDVKDIL
jgi:hypothetical protein